MYIPQHVVFVVKVSMFCYSVVGCTCIDISVVIRCIDISVVSE